RQARHRPAGRSAWLPPSSASGAEWLGADRMQRWHALFASQRVGRERGKGYLAVRFREDESTAAELARLVAAERDWCSFVEWSLASRDGELVMTISGDDATLGSFPF
ncbi:MAG TPA: hypothetical protein VFJ98_00640, partial [Mycobacteriales bacterium]|nr:hypothetical protein [Mycobacteriales bacterium]